MSTDISNKDFNFLQIALNEAIKSKMLMKHGCVAVLNGVVLATGYNNYRTYSRDKLLNHTTFACHAEVDVLRKIIKQHHKKNKVVLYIVRINNSGFFMNSKPCLNCIKLIKKYNIKRIVYSCSKTEFVKCRPIDCKTDHLSYGTRCL
jgi:tRNA(Arg) A34 adenosine deaminase TadA